VSDARADTSADAKAVTVADARYDPFSNAVADSCADTFAHSSVGLILQLLRGVCPVCQHDAHGAAHVPVLWDELYRRQ
jgi:hypothetical protein